MPITRMRTGCIMKLSLRRRNLPGFVRPRFSQFRAVPIQDGRSADRERSVREELCRSAPPLNSFSFPFPGPLFQSGRSSSGPVRGGSSHGPPSESESIQAVPPPTRLVSWGFVARMRLWRMLRPRATSDPISMTAANRDKYGVRHAVDGGWRCFFSPD